MIATVFLAAAQAMTFTADRIAADGSSRALTATGHVVAVSSPITIRGESMSRDASGDRMLFADPTSATTCTNACGHTHWNVTGELEYRDRECVILRNMRVKLWELPVLWLPCFYYPLDTDCGFSWMPGYTGRWGAYLLTKYTYHLLGNPVHDADSRWLTGTTRFDLRYQQGLAAGEEFKWNLGDFGAGGFHAYYAFDQNVDDVSSTADRWYNGNWGSDVSRDRYAFGLHHRWEATERDVVRVKGECYSDSYFQGDFMRTAMFNWKSQFLGSRGNGIFWDHAENDFSLGAEVSGRLNKFYGQTGRLPEIYLDVNPQPVFGLPVNYESANRIGYLTRNPAESCFAEAGNPYRFNPGPWASYESFRLDTYHRLTAPFRTFDDVLAVAPRLGYRGTYWGQSGDDALTGWEPSSNAGPLFRSILEGGVTLAARGTAPVGERWRHVVEPYFDVLAQQAWLAGGGNRPYVFDSLDASVMWDDQFAGRARNLPYSYYGVTPGLRNVWEKADEFGRFSRVVDLDVYAALQFDTTSYRGTDELHRLADPGLPNHGEHGCLAVPGARVRWMPSDDIGLMSRLEYDSDANAIAQADAVFQHTVSKTFKYDVSYALRNFRKWDFASSPYDARRMTEDVFNLIKMHYVQVGFEHEPIDWFAWGPYLRWDLRANELDGVGTWFDFRTDCLGFRFIVEYENAYTRIDGLEYGEDFSFGFYIYLRAFGPNNNIFLGSQR